MKTTPHLTLADKDGHIYDAPGFAMTAFDGKEFVVPDSQDMVLLPKFSKLFLIPECSPVGWNREEKKFETAGMGMVAVSAFLRPGFIRLYHPAFDRSHKDYYLPMWAYNPAGYYHGRYYVPAVLIDACHRWQPENYDDRKIVPQIKKFKKRFKKNRIIEHLSHCATHYHCFAAKNLFLKRWEAPLPVSRGCNARCLGCISLQEKEYFPASHERISFRPRVEEITEIAVAHLEGAVSAIVSFGQGCEGEPLTETDLISKAIKSIRRQTGKGIIHLNTNGYSPEKLDKLCSAGLDSVRISFSSARKSLYNAYYRPNNYCFEDVIDSLKLCRERGIYTTINYLVFPGITDEEREWQALRKVITHTKPHFLHLKNLNIDPFFYLKKMKEAGGGHSKLLGVKTIIQMLEKDFPEVLLGYFNRTRKEIEKHLDKRKK